MSVSLRYVARRLGSSPVHTVLSVLAVAFAVASLVCIQLLQINLSNSVRDSARVIAGGDVTVTWPLEGAQRRAVVAAVDKAESQGLVSEATLTTVVHASLRAPSGAVAPVVLRAVDQMNPLVKGAIELKDTQQVLCRVVDSGAAVVTADLASRLSLHVGQTGVVAITGKRTSPLIVRVGAVGTMSQAVSSDEALSGTVFVDSRDVPALSQRVGEVRFLSADRHRLAAQLRQRFPGAEVTLRDAVLQDHLGSIRSLTKIMLVLSAFTIFLTGISLAATAELEVAARLREIGILRALGASPRRVSLLFVLHILALGLAGGFLGIVIGTALARIAFGAALTMVGVPSGSFVLTIRPLLAGVIVAAAVAVLFGLGAIRAVRRVSPASVMRGLGPGRPSWVDRLLRGLFLVLAMVIVGLAVTGSVLLLLFPLAMLVALVCLELVVALVMRVLSMMPTRTARVRLVVANLTDSAGRSQRVIAVAAVCIMLIAANVLLATGVKSGIAATAGRDLGWDVRVSVPVRSARDAQRALQAEGAGVSSYRRVVRARAQLAAIDGRDAGGTVIAALQRSDDARTFFGGGRFDLQGFDPAQDGQSTMLAGRGLESRDADAAVVLGPVANALGLKVGDTVSLRFSDSATKTFRITGIAKKPVFVSYLILVPQKTLAKLPSDGTATFFVRTNDPEATAGFLRRALPDSVVYASPELLSSADRLIGSFVRFLSLSTVVASLAAIMVMMSTVAAVALARRSQVGLVKAIGASNRGILRLILWEQLFVALLSASVGIALGIGVLLVLALLIGIQAVFPTLAIATIFFVATAAMVLTGLATSSWAIRAQPSVSLRYE